MSIHTGFPWHLAAPFFREERDFVQLQDLCPPLLCTLADVSEQGQVQMGGEAAVEEHDSLVVFLYLLMRDHVTLGVIEERTLEIELRGEVELTEAAAGIRGDRGWRLTNHYLAGYAVNIAKRLFLTEQTSRAAMEERLREGENHVAALLRAPSMSESDRLTDRSAAKVWLGGDPKAAEVCGRTWIGRVVRDPRDPGQEERRG